MEYNNNNNENKIKNKKKKKFYYNNFSYTFNSNDKEKSDSNSQFNYNSNKDSNSRKNLNFSNMNMNKNSNKKDNIITNNFEIFSGFDIGKINLCTSCLRWKLPRTHHCRSCGKCILKMDHHCPWLANCIGFKNYKFFCLVIIYGFILSFIVFALFWETVLNCLYSHDVDLISTVFVCMCYTFDIGLMSFTFYLLNYNFNLVFSNETIIERSDKERYMDNIDNDNGINISGNYNTYSYDKGPYKNFTDVFGENPFLWFIPVENKQEYLNSFITQM
jgi:hypothetical protein